MQPGFGVRRGEKKNHNETTNKHPFNINKLLTKLFLIREKKNLLTKKKTRNHCFLIQYNYLCKRNTTFFKSSKSFMIELICTNCCNNVHFNE